MEDKKSAGLTFTLQADAKGFACKIFSMLPPSLSNSGSFPAESNNCGTVNPSDNLFTSPP